MFESDVVSDSEFHLASLQRFRSMLWKTFMGAEYVWLPDITESKGESAVATTYGGDIPDENLLPTTQSSKEYVPPTETSVEGLLAAGLDAPLG